MSTTTAIPPVPKTEDQSAAPSGYQRTEVGVIPADWEIKTLNDLGSFMKGKGIKRDDVTDDGLACIRYGELYTRYSNYVYSPVSRIPETVANTAQPLKTGDLLFAGSGETAEEIGKCVAYLGEEEAYAGGDIVILRPVDQNSLYLGHLLNHAVVAEQKARYGQGDAVVHISARNLAMVKLPLPPTTDEQDAIAEALSDVDRLIEALDKLIAKKRAIKQAAMQQLLTGKIRLPGFTGAWTNKSLGSCGATYGGITGKSKADFGHGSARYVTFLNVLENAVIQPSLFDSVDISPSESQNRVLRGDLLFNGTSETPGDLALGACVDQDYDDLYLNSFCFGFRFHKDTDHNPLFFAYFFRGPTGRQIMSALAQGATRYNMSKRQFLNLECELPEGDEQRAIAKVLSDMDAEIAAIEQRRDKTQQIKQGMMQQLLTGRVRLIEPMAETVSHAEPIASSLFPDDEPAPDWSERHTLFLGIVTDACATSGQAVGPLRRTKLAALLQRHLGGGYEGFHKLAAGPYPPDVRYNGPLAKAQERGYVAERMVGQQVCLVPGPRVADAVQQFDRLFGRNARLWLRRFLDLSREDLEVLTTVDMAAVELAAQGQTVDVEAVKGVIRDCPKWRPKLDRPCFSDRSIASAIQRGRQLFKDY